MNKKTCVCYENNNYPVDVKTNVEPVLRWTNSKTPAPPPLKNGGLFSGPESNAHWMPKPVVPTTTYFMQVLMKDIDPPPPPGATEQYITENRLGNNYTAMPGVSWFNSAREGSGPYAIKVIDTPSKQKSQNNNL